MIIRNLGKTRFGYGKVSDKPNFDKTHLGKFLDTKTHDSFGIFMNPTTTEKTNDSVTFKDRFGNELIVNDYMSKTELDTLFRIFAKEYKMEKLSISVVDLETVIKSILI